MSGELVVYKCVSCGKAYDSVQKLRGHLRVHRGEMVQTSFWARRELWEAFKAVAKKHNTTTCQLLNVALESYVVGDKTGAVRIGSPNPMVVHVHQYWLGKPRSSLRTLLERLPGVPDEVPRCDRAESINFETMQISCRDAGGPHSFARCENCIWYHGVMKLYLGV